MSEAKQLTVQQTTEYLGRLADVEKRLYLLKEERNRVECGLREIQPMQLPPADRSSFQSYEAYRAEHVTDSDRLREASHELKALEIEAGEYARKKNIVPIGCIVTTVLGVIFLILNGSSFGDVVPFVLIFLVISVSLSLASEWLYGYGKKYHAASTAMQEKQLEVERLRAAIAAKEEDDEVVRQRAYREEQQAFMQEKAAKREAQVRRIEQYNANAEVRSQVRATSLQQMKDAIGETEQVRADLYNLYKIISPKYRNLNAMCTMYEYFLTGRVSSLWGPYGAYNLYESEIRQNAIISTLDSIDKKVDDLKRGQYQLYLAVNDTNSQLRSFGSKLDTIAEDVNGIKTSSAVIAACSEATAANTEALMYIALAK